MNLVVLRDLTVVPLVGLISRLASCSKTLLALIGLLLVRWNP